MLRNQFRWMAAEAFQGWRCYRRRLGPHYINTASLGGRRRRGGAAKCDKTSLRAGSALAADLAAEPVATIQLPVRIPNGFHGNWVRDSVTPPPS